MDIDGRNRTTIVVKVIPPAVAYVYAPERKALQPIAPLAGFKGVLQVDGYTGYRALAEKGEVGLAFC